MKFRFWSSLLILPLLKASVTIAQTLSVASISPQPNMSATPRKSVVAVTFTHPLLPGSTSALKVYSSQLGGLCSRASSPAVVQGNLLKFSHTNPGFLPGETVFGTISKAAASSLGSLNRAHVFQFTVAADGTGQGNFQPGIMAQVGNKPSCVVTGDIDGDGDLDLIVANQDSYTVSILLNGGDATGFSPGIFSGGSILSILNAPTGLALGDVDEDGDLDLLVANADANAVMIYLNGSDKSGSHTGLFRLGSTVSVAGPPSSVMLGDVDGDGDMDLLATTYSFLGRVSVRLNGGDDTGVSSGTFSNGSDVVIGSYPVALALGDIDGDDDLDVLAANYYTRSVTTQLNGGDDSGSNTGLFTNGTVLPVGNYPSSLSLGDVDKNGFLDLVVANADTPGSVSVRLNQGNGLFPTGTTINVEDRPSGLALADVDADGDLDLLTANTGSNSVSIRLNGGNASGTATGTFSNGTTQAVGKGPVSIAVGDIDEDGDIDFLTADQDATTSSIGFNLPATLLPTRSTTVIDATFVVTPTMTTGPTVRYNYISSVFGQEIEIAVFTISGQCVWYQRDSQLYNGTIPIINLVTGWYIVKLIVNHDAYISRFYKI